MKAITSVIAAGLCVLLVSAAAQAETIARVILPGENVFCNELVILSGDEAVFKTPCADYDKARESAKQGILQIIDDLSYTGDYEDEQTWVDKVNTLGSSLEDALLTLEILFNAEYGEDYSVSRDEVFSNERTNNIKAIHAYGVLLRVLVQANNDWITLIDAVNELSLKMDAIKDMGEEIENTYNSLQTALHNGAKTKAEVEQKVSQGDIHGMWAKMNAMYTTLMVFEDEYNKILESVDLETFGVDPAVDENLSYLASAHRGQDWEQLYALSRDSRNVIGKNLVDTYDKLEDMIWDYLDPDLFGVFERGVLSGNSPVEKIKGIYNWYLRMD